MLSHRSGSGRSSGRGTDRLVELGAFRDERVELLEGRIVTMSPPGRWHADVIQQLTMLLAQALAGRAAVRVQLPFAASDLSEPAPDVALVPPGRYLDDHPREAQLVIEVADTSLREDRLKARVYAQSGILEYWIVALAERVIEVHRGPQGDGYARVSRHGAGEVLRPQAFADVGVAIADLLPPA